MKRLIAFCLAILVTVAGALPTRAAGSVLTAVAPAKVHMTAVGRIGGSSLAVAVQGGYAFVGQSAEFAVIDLRAPEQPRRVAYLPLAANDIALQDGYAYVTNAQGLAVIDVRRPEQPTQVGFQSAPTALGSLVVAGSYLYAGAPGSGFFVYDITLPAQPQLAASLRQVQVEGLAVQGEYVYLATGDGVQVVSVADPRRPLLTVLVRTPAPVESVTVSGSSAYLAVAPGALLIADIVDPAAPRLAGFLSIPTYVKNPQVAGEKVYIANGNRGVVIVDVSNQAKPRLLGVSKVGSLVTDVAIAGDTLLATDVLEGGLHVLDVRTPAQMSETSVYRAPGMTQNVAAQEHYAYLASGMIGDIAIVDFADPANPQGAGIHRMSERATFLQVSGDQLYAYGSADTVQVLDIADRAHPVSLDVFRLGSGCRVVAVQGQLSFVDDGSGVLHIYDTTATRIPQPVAMLAATGAIRDAVMTDDYMLAAAGMQGVLVAHRTDPLQPVQAAVVPMSGSAEHVAAWGDHGYVLTSRGDLITLDLTVPGVARIADRMALGVNARAMVLDAGRIFVAAGEAGIYHLDVTSGGAPLGGVRVYDTPGTALNLAVVDEFLLVADGYAGLLLLRMEIPAAPDVAPPPLDLGTELP